MTFPTHLNAKFIETEFPPLLLRDAYLASLCEPQERYLESMVEQGRTWTWRDKAYIVCAQNTVIEFYVTPAHENEASEIFHEALAASFSKSALVKTFDNLFIKAALSQPAKVSTVGHLFRRIANSKFEPKPDLNIQAGLSSDVKQVMEFDDGFFTGSDELEGYVSIGGLFILKQEMETVGCGIAMPTVQGRTGVVDIGMLVASAHRNRGFGTHIISFMKDHFLRQGIRPICGCSIENIGSRLALIRAGFTNDASILHIEY